MTNIQLMGQENMASHAETSRQAKTGDSESAAGKAISD